MVDHRWNIEKAKNNALKVELQRAKDNNEHDRITSIAADLQKSNKKLEKLLKNRD